ncbi:aldehyde dehydrogenase family protein [Limnobacter sp.]|uniref:aldehyde dehydrogenase family protein n=1 Tax=Limnobacter sp. TaxID=2003368 RepID=UPI003518BA54
MQGYTVQPVAQNLLETPAMDRMDNLQLISGRLHDVFERQKCAHLANPNPEFHERVSNLELLEETILRNESELLAAMSNDYGHRSRHESIMADIVATLGVIRHAKSNLKAWMKVRRVPTPWQLRPSVSYVHPQPLGVIGIIASWNFPVYLGFAGVASALGAGNSCMLKPSEHTPRTSSLMARLLENNFGQEVVAVVEGDASVGEAFSRLPFDHLLFTGSQRVGKLVARAAAENLTPVTMDLGGKSPLIVAPSGHLGQAAACAAQAKMINAGQMSVCPDYALVPRPRLDEFVQAVGQAAQKQYPSIRNNPDVSCVISAAHMERLQELVAEAKRHGARVLQINPAGELFEPASQKFPLTLVVDPSPRLRLMQEEVFGSILPIVPYDTLEQAVLEVQNRPRPPALYLFATSKGEKRFVLDHTVSGGVTVNDAMWHVLNNNMPFGGVGGSGMGSYTGKTGFDTLSKLKPVLEQSKFNAAPLLRAPYGPVFDKVANVLKKLA